MNKKFIQKYSLSIGLGSLTIGIILNKFVPNNDLMDLIIGFLFGLSIVFNIAFLITLQKSKR